MFNKSFVGVFMTCHGIKIYVPVYSDIILWKRKSKCFSAVNMLLFSIFIANDVKIAYFPLMYSIIQHFRILHPVSWCLYDNWLFYDDLSTV